MSRLRFKLHYIGLTVIMLVAIILNFYKLGQEGYGNLYYSAAVKSMLMSWHNFFFNSFDPKGFITIDKPPIGFWLQTLSAFIFGFNGWGLFFPQALAGVLSVALLYHLVARVFGPGSGLLSALFLALTPIVVATDRTNEVDSILMLVTLMATWAIIKITEQKSLKWLLVAFFFIGVGFNIKMMEAFLVLPAFCLFYFLSTNLSWYRKMAHLLFATVFLVVVSFSWSFIVDSISPDQRPYVGSTQNNSMVDLALKYNGINRLIGQHHEIYINSWPQQGRSHDRQKSIALDAVPAYGTSIHNPGKSYNSKTKQNMKSQQGIIGTNNKKLGFLRLFTTPQLVGQLSWLLPGVIIYLLSLLWGLRLRTSLNGKRKMVIFWTVWVITMFLFFSHIANMMNSYYMVMMAPGIAALTGVGFMEMWEKWYAKDKKGAWFLPLTLVCNAGFEISVVWMYPALRTPLSLVIIVLTLFALICLYFIKNSKEIYKRKIFMIAVLAGMIALVAAPTVWSISPIQYGGSETKPFAGPELKNQRVWKDETSSPKLESYLKANYRKGTFLVATLNATTAAPIFLDTNLPVMDMGGFKGSDPVLTIEKLQKLINNGQIRFFLLPGISRPNEQGALINWIRINCHIVSTYKWQDSKSQKVFGNHSIKLYEYVNNTYK